MNALAMTHLLQATGTSTNPIYMILLMVALFAIMYFVMIRPQKKQQKKDQEMRNALQIGDEITTIGGIMGRVVTFKEDSLIIETGADRNKMKITRWAVQTNNTANERLQAEREAAKAQAEKDKAEGKKKGWGRKKKGEITDINDAKATKKEIVDETKDEVVDETKEKKD
ncbi:MAG: preprotein translocase subunit YajC [Clostridia bacterium]